MNYLTKRLPAIFLSAAILLSLPSLSDFQQQRYLSLKDSHSALVNQESRLKQRRSDVQREIDDLQWRLHDKYRHLDMISQKLASVQHSIRDLERQLF